VAANIYSADYDDLLPTMGDGAGYQGDLDDKLGWQFTVQPYMKNLQIVENPKRDKPSGNVDEIEFKRLQHFAMPGRAATSPTAAIATQGYFQGTHVGSATRYEGVAGWSPSTAQWVATIGAPSYSTTQVEDISNTALIVEGSNWDGWFSTLAWSATSGPLSSCVRWNPSNWNANGTGYSYAITTTTKVENGLSGLKHGAALCAVPRGRTTYTATDSSAKSVNMRQHFYNPTPSTNNPAIFVVKGLNPTGI